MSASTMISKGRITLPKEVRDFLRAREGTKLDFVIQDGGLVVIRTVANRAQELRGLLREAKRKPVSLNDLNLAVKARDARLP